MKTTNHILHTAKITNNCPECYATNGLEFTFSQEEIENKLYAKAKKDILESLYCHTCNNTIYPVNWDGDIDRVYQYHKKLAKPLNTNFKLKPLAYVLILLDTIALAALVYFLK